MADSSSKAGKLQDGTGASYQYQREREHQKQKGGGMSKGHKIQTARAPDGQTWNDLSNKLSNVVYPKV